MLTSSKSPDGTDLMSIVFILCAVALRESIQQPLSPRTEKPTNRLQRFASCFLGAAVSRRSEHCQGGGGGRRAHDLDKRSRAVQWPAADTKPSWPTAFAARIHRWPFVEIPVTVAVILRRRSLVSTALRRQESLAESLGSAALLRQRPSERAAILRQESLKVAANVVGQHLTNVRGKASPLFSWV